MGWAVFVAIATLGITMLVNYSVSTVYARTKQKFNEKKDARTSIIVEFFENIKFVKLNALENNFIAKIIQKKEEEIKYINVLMQRIIFSSTVNDLGPALFLIVLNGFSLWFTGSITLEKAFTSAIILNIFKKNFRDIPDLMVSIADIIVSSSRISYYLFSEEVDTTFIKYMVHQDVMYKGTDAQKANSLILKKGNFYWRDEQINAFFAEEKAKTFKKKKSKAVKKLKSMRKSSIVLPKKPRS